MMLATIAAIAAQLVYDLMAKNLGFRWQCERRAAHRLPVMPDSATSCGRST